MLCFSVWPSAITRMCNYNLAQVKFNQSPQAQRNLVSQEGGGAREGVGVERKRKRREEGEEEKRRKKGKTGGVSWDGTRSWRSF